MKLLNYISDLLSNFKDRRTISNIKSMINNIIKNKSIQIYSNAENKAEYHREKRLIDGSLKTILDDKKLSKALESHFKTSLEEKTHLYLIHDICDIRKQYSQKSENLGKVLSLNKDIINGYSTFNTVSINEKGKELKLIDNYVYSNRESHFVTKKELDNYKKDKLDKRTKRYKEIVKHIKKDDYINTERIMFSQLEKINKSIKEANPEIKICHIQDRGFDGIGYFEYIDKELKDSFVIRLKLNRNSNEKTEDDKSYIKLEKVSFSNSYSIKKDKVFIKNKTYQQVKILIEWGLYKLNNNNYYVLRIQLFDRKGKNLFKKPMLIITNIEIKNNEQAFEIYRLYLKRMKIEEVFKFLKSVLGWEEFQVRDWESIKNIIALCYFIGAYFYEIESELTKNIVIQSICKLGNGKEKVTRFFFLKGLEQILIAQGVQQFIKENNISEEHYQEMLKYTLI